MTLAQQNTDLRTLLRKIEHLAYWSRCNNRILNEAALDTASAVRALGLATNSPQPNMNDQYYKDWIVDSVKATSEAVGDWAVRDCTLTSAYPAFDSIKKKIEPCGPKVDEIDAPLVRPADGRE